MTDHCYLQKVEHLYNSSLCSALFSQSTIADPKGRPEFVKPWDNGYGGSTPPPGNILILIVNNKTILLII